MTEHGRRVSLFRHRRPGRDEAGAADRGDRSDDRRRARLRRSRHGQVDGGACARGAAAADARDRRLPLRLRSGTVGHAVRGMRRTQGVRRAEESPCRCTRGRPAARCHRRPRGRRARSRTRARARRKGVRAGIARARTSGLPVHRRSQPARGSSGRSADRRRRIGRERRRARGPERAPPGALRAGRQRQSGGRRTAAATPRSLRSRRRREDARGPGKPRRSRASPRQVRTRSDGVRGDLGKGGSEAAPQDRCRTHAHRLDAVYRTRRSNAPRSCACVSAPTGCAPN